MYKRQVVDCAVTGVEDPRWGEVGLAFVQMEPGTPFDEEKLHAYLSSRLSTIKCPRHILTIEKVPRNTTGKLLIGELEKLAKHWNEGKEQTNE